MDICANTPINQNLKLNFAIMSLAPLSGAQLQKQKEMTLDRRLFAHTIKGHFCSLLVSNIFCDPLFLLSTLFDTALPSKTNLLFPLPKGEHPVFSL
jgi:hypothetical protein